MRKYQKSMPGLKHEVDYLQTNLKIIQTYVDKLIDKSIDIIKARVIFSPSENLLQVNLQQIEEQLKETKDALHSTLSGVLYFGGMPHILPPYKEKPCHILQFKINLPHMHDFKPMGK